MEKWNQKQLKVAIAIFEKKTLKEGIKWLYDDLYFTRKLNLETEAIWYKHQELAINLANAGASKEELNMLNALFFLTYCC